MKTTNMILLLVLAAIPTAGLAQPANEVAGWFRAGSQPNDYDMGYDNVIFQSGQQSTFIESIADSIDGFGTLMQSCSANDYLGTQVKMTGYIKSESVSGWAGMWFRVDHKSEQRSLSFDNMSDRPVRGNSDWTKCEITLDVPVESGRLNYGVLLHGTGKVWFDNVSFEIVERISEEDETNSGGWPPPVQPTNLDFEE